MLHSIPHKSYSEDVYNVLSDLFGGVNISQSGFCVCANNPPLIYWGEMTRDGYQLTLAQCASTFNEIELETVFVFLIEPYYRKATLSCTMIDGQHMVTPGKDVQRIALECLKKWKCSGYKVRTDSNSLDGYKLLFN